MTVEFTDAEKSGMRKLLATAMTGKGAIYRGRLDGMPITLVGYAEPNERGNFDMAPLAILITDELLEHIEVINPD